jgi:dihydroxyacetone kinase-like predicted kinase
MTNARNMTLEQRIVQTLKNDHLMKLVGDEDAIHDLVVRALKQELFEDRTIKINSYGGKETEPSAVVKAAREAAAKVATRVAETYIDEIMATPAMKQAMAEVIPGLIVAALARKAENIWDKYRDQNSMEAVIKIRSAMGM